MWIEFDVGSLLAPRVFLRVLRFSSLHKYQLFQIAIQPRSQMFTHELLGDYSLHYDVKSDLPITIIGTTNLANRSVKITVEICSCVQFKILFSVL